MGRNSKGEDGRRWRHQKGIGFSGEGTTQGLEGQGDDFSFYSEQGGSPGRSLSRRGTGSEPKGILLAVYGEQTVGTRPPGG